MLHPANHRMQATRSGKSSRVKGVMLWMGRGMFLHEMRARAVLAFFPDVEALNRAVVSHYPSVNQAFATLVLVLLQHEVILL